MCDMLTMYEIELAEVKEKIDYFERKKERIEGEIWEIEAAKMIEESGT